MPKFRTTPVSLPPLVVLVLETGDYTPIRGEGWVQAFAVAGKVLRAALHGGEVVEWVEHGEWITAGWIDRFPGRRPWAWWALQASAPRECLGVGTPTGAPLWRLRVGVPYEWHQVEPGTELWLESEPHFLRRHGLLEPAERRRLRARDFEPEPIVITEEEEESCE